MGVGPYVRVSDAWLLNGPLSGMYHTPRRVALSTLLDLLGKTVDQPVTVFILPNIYAE